VEEGAFEWFLRVVRFHGVFWLGRPFRRTPLRLL
jgi:hypothetical protein